MILNAGCNTYRTKDGCLYECMQDRAHLHCSAISITSNLPAPSVTMATDCEDPYLKCSAKRSGYCWINP